MSAVMISVRDGWIVVEEEKATLASDDQAAVKLATCFLHYIAKGFDIRTLGVTCSSSVDFPQEDGVPAGISVDYILNQALGMLADNTLLYKAKFKEFCQERGLKGKTKKRSVRLAAITRMDFSISDVEIPEGITEQEVTDWFYDKVDGSDYNDDHEYWERGNCYVTTE